MGFRGGSRRPPLEEVETEGRRESEESWVMVGEEGMSA